MIEFMISYSPLFFPHTTVATTAMTSVDYPAYFQAYFMDYPAYFLPVEISVE